MIQNAKFYDERLVIPRVLCLHLHFTGNHLVFLTATVAAWRFCSSAIVSASFGNAKTITPIIPIIMTVGFMSIPLMFQGGRCTKYWAFVEGRSKSGYCTFSFRKVELARTRPTSSTSNEIGVKKYPGKSTSSVYEPASTPRK